MTEYPNVQVTYTQGAPPNLFMKDADGNIVEEIGISNWKLECALHARKCAPARWPPLTFAHASSDPPRAPHELHALALRRRQAHPRVLRREARAARGSVSRGPSVRPGGVGGCPTP